MDRLTLEAEKFTASEPGPSILFVSAEFAVHLPLQAKPGAIEHFQGKAPAGAPQHNPIYAAMASSLDENVGRVLKKLDELGLAERTVVFFMSDNGGLLYEGKSKDNVTSNAAYAPARGISMRAEFASQ